jgi:hypothetical protein
VRAFACVWTLLFCFPYLSSCYFVSHSRPGERTKKKCSLPTSRKITQFYLDADATLLHLTTKPPNNQPVLVPLGLEPIYRNQHTKSSTSTVKCSQDSTLTSDTGSTPTKPNTIINSHWVSYSTTYSSCYRTFLDNVINTKQTGSIINHNFMSSTHSDTITPSSLNRLLGVVPSIHMCVSNIRYAEWHVPFATTSNVTQNIQHPIESHEHHGISSIPYTILTMPSIICHIAYTINSIQ